LLLRVLICAVPHAKAQIYGGLDGNGSIVLSNFRSELADQLVIRDPNIAPDARPAALSLNNRFSALIDKAAQDAELSPGLLRAVISVESGFDARAVSAKGAQGLMQLMPATARSLGVSDPFDPSQNIAAGAAHLRSLLVRFDNNLELALAAYNAGADAVVKAGYRIPKFAETRAYVPRVLTHMERFDGTVKDPTDREASARPGKAAVH
jgi:soluble lytic murein transglycosylase-like protein